MKVNKIPEVDKEYLIQILKREYYKSTELEDIKHITNILCILGYEMESWVL